MKVEWNYEELKNFAVKLGDLNELNTQVKKASQALARELHKMLVNNTPVKTGRLVSGWNGNNLSFTAYQYGNGFRVTLTNDVPYAQAVNDGHYSYNQFGGPYIVKNRTVKYTRGNSDKTFVYGHFFVEKSTDALTEKASDIIYPYIAKWFRGCCGGK